MRAALINTGTELLLGDVQDAHLAFIAREIFPLGLRIEERRTVPDTDAIRRTLAELLPRCEILFVTGGLGPTGDDITREMVADVLGLELRQDPELLSSLRRRLQVLFEGKHQSTHSVAAPFCSARAAARASADVPQICHTHLAVDRTNSCLGEAHLQNRWNRGVGG